MQIKNFFFLILPCWYLYDVIPNTRSLRHSVAGSSPHPDPESSVTWIEEWELVIYTIKYLYMYTIKTEYANENSIVVHSLSHI